MLSHKSLKRLRWYTVPDVEDPTLSTSQTLLACHDKVTLTVLLSRVTIFLFTKAIRHLFTRAWLRSGGFTKRRTTMQWKSACKRQNAILDNALSRPLGLSKNVSITYSIFLRRFCERCQQERTEGQYFWLTGSCPRNSRGRNVIALSIASYPEYQT